MMVPKQILGSAVEGQHKFIYLTLNLNLLLTITSPFSTTKYQYHHGMCTVDEDELELQKN